MKQKYLIILVLIILIILFFYKKSENITSIPKSLSDEAIQNISSVYSDTAKTVTFNNIRTTGNLIGNLTGDVTGNVNGNLTSPNGKYKLSIDNNGVINVVDNTGNNVGINGKHTGNFTSPNGNYKLNIDDKGSLNLIDNSGNNINIRGKYTGRFYSPKGDYYIKVHNASEAGVLAGYTTNPDKLTAIVINFNQNFDLLAPLKRELTTVEDPFEGVTI